MNRARGLGIALFSAVVGLTLAASAGGCGTDAPAAMGGGVVTPRTSGASCATPDEGCPCDEPGARVECGEVAHRSGDYVSCAMGERECEAADPRDPRGQARWGPCVGDTFVTTEALIGAGPLGGLAPAALGAAGPCPTSGPDANPCDPYCNAFVDEPSGVPLPSGGPGAPVCQSPLDWTAYYGAYPAGQQPNGPLPTTCASGPPDTCSNDMTCAAGVCSPRTASASGACTGVDFTLSTPCFDGTNFTFQLCNRGSADATSGILPIAHHLGTASAAASTCTRATNGAAGQCNVDLGVTPLAAGQCRQITPATDCGIDTSTGDHFFFVNYANTPAVSGTPALAECNTCNNFTATTSAAAALPGAACTPASCGTSLPSGGQYPPNFSSTDGTNHGCAGATDDFVGGSCSAAPGAASNCAQDFHCDAATDACVWNVTGDWVDSSCAGVDLTVGVGCQDTTNVYHLPVCNRGLGTLAAGSTIQVNITTNSWTPATACTTNVGSYHCGLTLSQPLASGACVDIPGCTGGTGQRELIVNPLGTLAECTPCNNWSHVKTTGMGCKVACTVPPPPAVQIYAHTGGTLYRVDPVTYAITNVGAMSGCGTVFDLAIDAAGNMYANTSSKLYKVSYPSTGSGPVSCTALSNNPTSFNGLTFTPVSLLSPAPAAEPLHGAANNGGWYEITLTGGGAPVSYNLIGYYGGSANKIESSGDAVGIIGDAEYVVVKSGYVSLPGGDHLWKLDPNTGAKIADITPTGSGLGACYGIAYWGGKTYLFCGSPQSGIYTIDTVNGATMLVKATPGIAWNGAAVTTSSPVVPPAAAPPPPPVQYFTRDYHAICPAGTRIKWRYFSWQATIPPGGAIEFSAQTADDDSAFGPPDAPPSATPPAVSAGAATVTTTPAGTWFSDANTVDWHLANEPPGQISKEWLRITMKFVTGSGTVPTLTTWKQTYDCVPAE